MRAPDFWQRDGAAARLLSPLGALYGASVALKARFASPRRAAMPVICVGNLTAGGSGKTPVALAIAEMLAARGARPCFLTRGYGGRTKGPVLVRADDSAADVGDEALLLARQAPTIVARDRAAGAALAAGQGDVLVMDDGHQNFTLAKDLSLVVVDAATGFGNGRAIPAGPLREPVAQGLARADAVILVGDGAPDLAGYRGPVLRARLEIQPHGLAGKRVFAFAGIGRPEKFLASLEQAGAIMTGNRLFADHHAYDARQIAALRREAGAALLVTTRKDLMRLAPRDRDGIAVLDVQARFEAPAQMARLLDRARGAV